MLGGIAKHTHTRTVIIFIHKEHFTLKITLYGSSRIKEIIKILTMFFIYMKYMKYSKNF